MAASHSMRWRWCQFCGTHSVVVVTVRLRNPDPNRGASWSAPEHWPLCELCDKTTRHVARVLAGVLVTAVQAVESAA